MEVVVVPEVSVVMVVYPVMSSTLFALSKQVLVALVEEEDMEGLVLVVMVVSALISL